MAFFDKFGKLNVTHVVLRWPATAQKDITVRRGINLIRAGLPVLYLTLFCFPGFDKRLDEIVSQFSLIVDGEDTDWYAERHQMILTLLVSSCRTRQ